MVKSPKYVHQKKELCFQYAEVSDAMNDFPVIRDLHVNYALRILGCQWANFASCYKGMYGVK